MEFMPTPLLGKITKGRKLVELDAIEAMEFEAKLKRSKQLYNERLRIQYDIDEMSVWMKKWWLEMRRKHNIEVENVVFDEGGVYEAKQEGQ